MTILKLLTFIQLYAKDVLRLPSSHPHDMAKRLLLLLPYYTDGETEAPKAVTFLGGGSARFQSEHVATKTHRHSPTWFSYQPATLTPLHAGGSWGLCWCQYCSPTSGSRDPGSL